MPNFLSSFFSLFDLYPEVNCSGINHLIHLSQKYDQMANIRPTMPKLIFKPNADILPTAGVIDPDDAMDLVTYIGTLLPESVNPNYVLLGIGLGLAGVAGTAYMLKKTSEVSDLSSGLTHRGKPVKFPRLENGERPSGIVIRNHCPRGRKTPCIAAYPLKLEMFLRVAGIKYRMESREPDGNNNNDTQPIDDSMLVLDMENLPEAQVCMKNLSQKFGIDMSRHLSPEQRGIELAFGHLLEQKIYWALSLYRWVYDGARSLEKIQSLPVMNLDSISSVAKTVEHAAFHHGIGQRTPSEVMEEAVQDLAALSIQLGTNKYLMGNQPTELDSTAFAMLSQIIWTMDGPLHEAVSHTYPNLSAYCWRLRNEYWPDWDRCLSN